MTTRVPWAEGRSRYTPALRLSWTAVDGIMERAVRRGLARRETRAVRRLSVDETSFKRGRRYVTVVSDSDTKAVLHVAPGRGREALEAFYRKVGKRRLAAVESVSMDIWRPYVAATEAWVAGARRKTAFDRFHVAKHLGDAVDKVRRAEHKELQAAATPCWRARAGSGSGAPARRRKPRSWRSSSCAGPIQAVNARCRPQPGPLRRLRMVSLGVPKLVGHL